MMAKTVAELQIEILKQMKAGRGDARGTLPVARRVNVKVRRTAAVRTRTLPLAKEAWSKLEGRLSPGGEFKSSRAMGAWAARLMLALPAGVAALSPQDHDALFQCMRAWALTRGLK